MFWDRVAILYSAFEKIYNGNVNMELCDEVSELIEPKDIVLECACGTGMISRHIAVRCRKLIATDASVGMLRETRRRCRVYDNVWVRKADIMELKFDDNRFDKVVAGNVIHLLDEPNEAVKELIRVCKPGGKVIIPTYINQNENSKNSIFSKLVDMLGADFKWQFNIDTYQEFFKKEGYTEVGYRIIEGKVPSMIAIITKGE